MSFIMHRSVQSVKIIDLMDWLILFILSLFIYTQDWFTPHNIQYIKSSLLVHQNPLVYFLSSYKNKKSYLDSNFILFTPYFLFILYYFINKAFIL